MPDPPSPSLLHSTDPSARKYFDGTRALCACNPRCKVDDLFETSLVFARMDEENSINAVGFMMFALTSPSAEGNDLLAWDPKRQLTRKRKLNQENVSNNNRSVFAIRGLRLCRHVFAAVVQMNVSTVHRHAQIVATSKNIAPYRQLTSNRRRSILSSQSLVAQKFLLHFGSRNGLQCPTGRGSKNSNPLVWLPSDTLRSQVYEGYCNRWENMILYVQEERKSAGLERVDAVAPLAMSSFLKFWSEHCPTLRIMKPGSDYCDLCTYLNNLIATDIDDETKEFLSNSLKKHKDETVTEFKTYTELQEAARNNPTSGVLHFVFDFAEKVLLPHLLRQPGPLRFITGLKFDIFGVSVSNLRSCDIFRLPEGHWPSNRTANEIVSMLNHSIAKAKATISGGEQIRHLQLHANNCGGQNKNRFILWFFMWRTTIGLEDTITLYFLIAVLTKNRCDGAFGFIKRELKRRDVITPREIVSVVSGSSHTNNAVLSKGRDLDVLEDIFGDFLHCTVSFKITRYHVFLLSGSDKQRIRVKKTTSDTSWETIRLLRRGKSPTEVCVATTEKINSGAVTSSWLPLDEVASAQEGTRRAYLKKNIIDRYYKNNPDVAEQYFADGK